ncbi:MAG: RHS repeat protein, partial [Theionarchaea archaeon]|nr:RHS repeat protein [Theionarchaea archaeon]
MKMVKAIGLAAILLFGLISIMHNLAAVLVTPSEEEVVDFSFDRMRRFALQDAVPNSERTFGETEIPDHPPLQIVPSDVSGFEHMAQSPYYKVFFEKTRVKMVVQDYWIELRLPDQELGEVKETESVVSKNTLSVSEIFESVDVSFQVNTSLLTEALILKESKDTERLILKISWDGLKPVYKEDGSILFINEEEKEILEMLPPFMEDATGATCEDLHYELIETVTGYELHKVIDENGLKWLKTAAYPVVIDPSMQTIEDAWESSGLTRYWQYFQNLREFVNPATGHLTITQTDLVIPERGLDLTISRVHQTPAVFYGIEPYDYEAPPINVGKGWQLDFPYIGDKYLHLWGGTVYKIEWDGNQFINHVGTHFILIKNGDSTHTLTTASGTVCEFAASGVLTQIKDIDQNTITFGYSGGTLTTITDTIGRQVTLSYSGSYLHKILYNNCEIEYSYDEYGRLVLMDDF